MALSAESKQWLTKHSGVYRKARREWIAFVSEMNVALKNEKIKEALEKSSPRILETRVTSVQTPAGVGGWFAQSKEVFTQRQAQAGL